MAPKAREELLGRLVCGGLLKEFGEAAEFRDEFARQTEAAMS